MPHFEKKKRGKLGQTIEKMLLTNAGLAHCEISIFSLFLPLFPPFCYQNAGKKLQKQQKRHISDGKRDELVKIYNIVHWIYLM